MPHFPAVDQDLLDAIAASIDQVEADEVRVISEVTDIERALDASLVQAAVCESGRIAEEEATERALAASLLEDNAIENAAAAGGGEQARHPLRSIYETIAIYKENPANYKDEILDMAFNCDIQEAARGSLDLMSEMQELIFCSGQGSLFEAWPPQE